MNQVLQKSLIQAEEKSQKPQILDTVQPFEYYETLESQPLRLKNDLDSTLHGIVDTATEAIHMGKILQE